jgi:hypothetical protein
MTLRRLDWPPFFLSGLVLIGYVGAMVTTGRCRCPRWS